MACTSHHHHLQPGSNLLPALCSRLFCAPPTRQSVPGVLGNMQENGSPETQGLVRQEARERRGRGGPTQLGMPGRPLGLLIARIATTMWVAGPPFTSRVPDSCRVLRRGQLHPGRLSPLATVLCLSVVLMPGHLWVPEGGTQAFCSLSSSTLAAGSLLSTRPISAMLKPSNLHPCPSAALAACKPRCATQAAAEAPGPVSGFLGLVSPAVGCRQAGAKLKERLVLSCAFPVRHGGYSRAGQFPRPWSLPGPW